MRYNHHQLLYSHFGPSTAHSARPTSCHGYHRRTAPGQPAHSARRTAPGRCHRRAAATGGAPRAARCAATRTAIVACCPGPGGSRTRRARRLARRRDTGRRLVARQGREDQGQAAARNHDPRRATKLCGPSGSPGRRRGNTATAETAHGRGGDERHELNGVTSLL